MGGHRRSSAPLASTGSRALDPEAALLDPAPTVAQLALDDDHVNGGRCDMDMSWLGWIIVGAIAGGVASLIVPGRTPGGIIGAIIVGIIGGLLGGWLWSILFGAGPSTFIGTLVLSILGAVIILYALRAAGGRARTV
jgi:uncharacterized membrane protein YeaQ/YmgE (transglycosylase-associated protein family)